MLKIRNIEPYIGQVFTLEKLCEFDDNRKLSTNYKRTIEQLMARYDITPTGIGRGKKQEFVLNGYATIFKSKGRSRELEKEKDIIIRDLIFKADCNITVEKISNYDYVVSTSNLLKVFGFVNIEYNLSSHSLDPDPYDSPQKIVEKIFLKQREKELNIILKYMKAKKKNIYDLFKDEGIKEYLVWNRTFWVTPVDGNRQSADHYYNIETNKIYSKIFVDGYIRNRKKQIVQNWEIKTYAGIDKSPNPFQVINGVPQEKEIFLTTFSNYCNSIKRLDEKEREYSLIPKDINPYAHALKTIKLPDKRPTNDEIKLAQKSINDFTIQKLKKIANEDSCNMEYMEELINKYIKLTEGNR